VAGSRQRLGFYRFQAFFSFEYRWRQQVSLGKVGAALDALDINAVYIAFQGKVSPASFTGLGPDETEHISPFFTIHWLLKLQLIYFDDILSRGFVKSGQPLFCG
jgi:hypothetical protein